MRSFALSDCRPVRNARARKRWADAHPYCLCCGIPAERAPWPYCQTHHLVKPGRSDEDCNYLQLCNQCHSLTHGACVRLHNGNVLPVLTLGMQFELKRLRDPSAWNPQRLEQLWARHLPDLETLPLVYRGEFQCWRPDDPTNKQAWPLGAPHLNLEETVEVEF